MKRLKAPRTSRDISSQQSQLYSLPSSSTGNQPDEELDEHTLGVL